ncbi:hypothetical protein QT381_07495 [Galbitalea sp. SE-J8]|uniref:hypothetical protein n=1 Tax=Galbitalea sp. SE-J8 TaxID=3054952 RepID=UPI00259C6EE9|nr:hypothetical protein [Galbitalea sp. SE-J8]MDM4762849.1 hypothetical protein [Galbitalea sp. SE-J8]
MTHDLTTFASPDDFEYLALLEFERAEARRIARRVQFARQLARESVRQQVAYSGLERGPLAIR